MDHVVDQIMKDDAATARVGHLPTPALSPITEHGHVNGHGNGDGNGNGDNNGIQKMDDMGQLPTPTLRESEETVQGTYFPHTPRNQENKDKMKDKDKDKDKENTKDKGERNGVHDAEVQTSLSDKDGLDHKPLKLSPAQIFKLTSSPGSIPWRTASPIPEDIPLLGSGLNDTLDASLIDPKPDSAGLGIRTPPILSPRLENVPATIPLPTLRNTPGAPDRTRPVAASRSNSSPVMRRKQSSVVPRNPVDSREQTRSTRPAPSPLKLGDHSEHQTPSAKPSHVPDALPSASSVLPLPPLSLPTYLQLELSSERPSALYIHRSVTSDIPYESSRVKFDRLLNFLLLPPQLEQTLCFGALACLDAWLYTFTILPLRFLKAVVVWLRWWFRFVVHEARDITSFIWTGLGRLWQRKRQASLSASRASSISDPVPTPTLDGAPPPRVDLRIDDSAPTPQRPPSNKRRSSTIYRHKRVKSTPSALLPNHKADLLQGLLIVFTCMILLRFDASRVYHNIRGQSAIKLYVIYNSLEVFDRLFSAIGQDVLECLFSSETLERKPNGRSKISRPFWMFVLALAYNVIHASALFYQVITLNVAVNSYSNALLTLLMSNQFVEIKGSVFKMLEKENLFQMTCADVVERFQLWLMLLIIALRNIVEVGGLSMNSFSPSAPSPSYTTTGPSTQSMGILPQAFTLVPKWSGQVLGPFLIVLGSEMIVDWLKHAYINKFNSVKPDIYGRFLDVLAKDYYSNAFVEQNLMKRLGLPVLPLACLFIRASVQTYHMFVATHMPMPLPSSATALVVESTSAETSPATTAALAHIDHMFRRALGRSSFGAGVDASSAFSWWSLDDVIAFATMVVFFLVLYLFLLAFKLVLGICLLNFARSRYKGMRDREKQSYDTGSRRVGGFGHVEVDDDKRKWIYEDDEDGLNNLRARDAKAKEKTAKGEVKLDGVGRYMMVAKRIW